MKIIPRSKKLLITVRQAYNHKFSMGNFVEIFFLFKVMWLEFFYSFYIFFLSDWKFCMAGRNFGTSVSKTYQRRTYVYIYSTRHSVKSVCGTICSTTHSVYSVCVCEYMV